MKPTGPLQAPSSTTSAPSRASTKGFGPVEQDSPGGRAAGAVAGERGAQRGTGGGTRKGRLAFFREFVKSPAELGTCFTSSPALGKAITEGMGLETAKTVIETGAGAGAITEDILRRIQPSPACTFVAIELNAGLAIALKERFPRVRVYREDAQNIRSVCERENIVPGTVDVVISSLPFLLFPAGLQERIIHETAAVLKPGGTFAMLTYRVEAIMPSVKRFRRIMEREFSTVADPRRITANFPPAHIYRCEK